MDYLTTIISALLGGGIVSFAQFLINRHDKRSDVLNEIIKKLDRTEKDCVRTQLLMMMNHYPNRQDEIMSVARHYFVDDRGNWFMTSLFKHWCEDNKIEVPNWFDE